MHKQAVRLPGGFSMCAGFQPHSSSPLVARLLEGHGVVLGKTRMHELAVGVTTINMHGGPVLNPYNNTMHTGGLPHLSRRRKGGLTRHCLLTSTEAALKANAHPRVQQTILCCEAGAAHLDHAMLDCVCAGSSGGAAAAVAMRMGTAGFCSDTGVLPLQASLQCWPPLTSCSGHSLAPTAQNQVAL